MERNFIKRKILAGSLLFCAVLAGISCSGHGGYRYTTVSGREKAPEFSLKSPAKKSVSLSDLRGKVVLVHFWATWCASCVHELQSLQKLYRFLNEKDFQIVAIAVEDNWETINKIKDKIGLDFIILNDEGREAATRYKISGLPQSFMVGRSGEFLEFTEPENRTLVTRTNGPQNWGSLAVVEDIRALLAR